MSAALAAAACMGEAPAVAVVSICIPTFNGARHLPECLASALGQTLRDVEVLVVDDGSTDETLAIARDFDDERLRIHQNEQRLGLADNWNRRVQLASGTWIKFLFQDDTLESDGVAKLVAAGSEDRPLVVGHRQLRFEAGADESVRDYFGGLQMLDQRYADQPWLEAESISRILAGEFAVNVLGEPSAVLVHRDVFERLGAFSARMIQLLDLEFFARVAVHHGVALVSEPVATFRIHPGSTSSKNAAARAFHKDLLDPMVLAWQYAYAEPFAPMRAVLGGRRFARTAGKLAERSWQQARAAARSGDSATLDAWHRVVVQCPGLRRSPWRWWQRLRTALAFG